MTPNKLIIGLVFAIVIVIIMAFVMMYINWQFDDFCRHQTNMSYETCTHETR